MTTALFILLTIGELALFGITAGITYIVIRRKVRKEKQAYWYEGEDIR